MTIMQRVAQLSGWIFVLMAIWGGARAGLSMEADPAQATRLWGLFPVNFLHNLVHLIIGLWGLGASRGADTARGYGIGAGILYVALAALGVFLPRGFGLVPLGGHDIWLHAVLGVLLLIAGVTLAPRRIPAVQPAPTRTVHPPTTAGPEDSRDAGGPDEPHRHRPTDER